jgi:chorismate mutase
VHPALRHQLRSLDQVILSLLDERARLVADVPPDDPGRKAAVEDMLARHDGPFPAQGITDVFQAIDRNCAEIVGARAMGARALGDRAR